MTPHNTARPSRYTLALLTAGVMLAASPVYAVPGKGKPPKDGGGGGDAPDLPMTIDLTGTVRDFREKTADEGHPDFEHRPDHGFGHYCGNVAPILGEDGKPVFTGDGFKVVEQWKDVDGRPIAYTMFDASRGDVPGVPGMSDSGGIHARETFDTWFNDTPGVNLSQELTLTLRLQDDGSYVFDDKLDPAFEELGGFFPIEDKLLGNPGGSPNRNFHFTFELVTNFTYREAEEQIFRFIGDDDVWVFIDDKLVIDIGGVHPAVEQYVDLTRLGLRDGDQYSLRFFFAERHRTESNFRIHTNLLLQSVDPPAITAAFD